MKPMIPFLALLLTSCAQTNVPSKSSRWTPSAIRPVPRIQGQSASPRERADSRTPSTLKRYQLGRLLSKDRRTMHEAHRVYRVVESPRWILDPTARSQVSRQSVSLFHSAEIEAELRQQERVTAELIAAKERLEDLSTKTQETLAALGKDNAVEAANSESAAQSPSQPKAADSDLPIVNP